MEKIVYYSEPIGKEKIILELTTLKENKKESKKVKLTKLEERNKLYGREDSYYQMRTILTNLEERNNLVNMNDPYWQWYFKND